MEDTTFHEFMQPEQVQTQYIDHIVGPRLRSQGSFRTVRCEYAQSSVHRCKGLVPSGPYNEAILSLGVGTLKKRMHIATGVSVKSVSSGSVVLENGESFKGDYIVLCLGQYD